MNMRNYLRRIVLAAAVLLLGGMAAPAADNPVVSMYYRVDNEKHYTQKVSSFHAAFPREARFVLMLKFADGSVRPAREEIQYLKRNRYRVDLAISDHTNCLVSPTAGPDRGYVVDVKPDAQEGRKGGSAAFSATLVRMQDGKGEETVAIAPCTYTWAPAVVRRYKLNVVAKAYLRYTAFNPPSFALNDYRDLELPKGIRYQDVLIGYIMLAPGSSNKVYYQAEGWYVSESEHLQSNDYVFVVDGGKISTPVNNVLGMKTVYSDAWWKYAQIGGHVGNFTPNRPIEASIWQGYMQKQMDKHPMSHDTHKCLSVAYKMGGSNDFLQDRDYPVILSVSIVATGDVLATCEEAWARTKAVNDFIFSIIDLPDAVDKALKIHDLISEFFVDKESDAERRQRDILHAVAGAMVNVHLDTSGFPVLLLSDSYFQSDLPPHASSSGNHPYDQNKDRLEVRLFVTLSEIDDEGNEVGQSQELDNTQTTLN